MKKLVISILVIVTLAISLAGCTGNGNQVYVIPQKDIDTAVSQVANNPNWCIGNALVTVADYQPGDTVNEVVVVHNGSDSANTFSVAPASDYAVLNDWNANTEQSGTVTLQPMESKVVYLTFKIPARTKFNPAYIFMVNVNKVSQNSDFIQISYQQKWKVY